MSVIAVSSAESSYCSGNNFTTWWGSFTFVSRFSQSETKHQGNDNTNVPFRPMARAPLFPQFSTLFIYLLIYVCWRLLQTAANKQTVVGHRILRDWVWHPTWPSWNRIQGRMKAPGEKMNTEVYVLRAGQGLTVMIQQAASRTLLKP